MSTNAYPVRCSMCHADVSSADCIEIWPQAWQSPMAHCCPRCVALWEAWGRDEAFVDDSGELVYRYGCDPEHPEERTGNRGGV